MDTWAAGDVICDHYEYDATGRLVSHWQTVATGDVGISAATQDLDAGPIQVEPQPLASRSCPACRGTGRVMLLVSSVPCEKCSGSETIE